MEREKGTPVGVVYRVRDPALDSWEDQPPAAYEVFLGYSALNLGPPLPYTPVCLVTLVIINVIPVRPFQLGLLTSV